MHHFKKKKKSYYAETLKLQKTINSVFHGPLVVQSMDNIVKTNYKQSCLKVIKSEILLLTHTEREREFRNL